MIIVLAEKPSAARNFAKALDGQHGTYNGEDYRICALRGHVLGLVPPEKQVESDKEDYYKKWALDRLPWNLQDLAWKKGIGKDCKQILTDLKKALEGADEVAIATDVDPSGEGELLAWEALDWCGWKGNTTRMYFADEAPKSVQKAFVERKAIASMEKDGDYIKAVVRERWDFASMQFVRAATCVAKQHGFRTVVRQGRLKSVMVKLVGDQLKAYNEYVKKPFFEARFKDQNGNVFRRIVDDESDIRFDTPEKVDLSGLHESEIVKDSRSLKHTAPGKLLDLAGMSAILAKNGFKPDSVLATYQKMYEDQVVSYPRTEDKEITPEQFEELLPLADAIADVVGVDPALLTHRTPRKTHVKEGGAHGANRPGINVPNSLEALSKYGKEAAAIYELLAKNYLAMLCEDYEYELVKGHVSDFPEYVGETKVPVKPGFKAVFDAEASSAESAEGEEGENNSEFSAPAVPYVHEGANKRPQKPTMKWLNKRLEKYNVGTGATRTSTLAEITANEDKALMKENKGALTLTDCGNVSYTLLDGCQIASPEVTEKLFESMARVGKFEEDPKKVLATVTDMVVHDREVMVGNGAKLSALGLGGKKVIGKCPVCGADVYDGKATVQCSSNKYKKNDDGSFSLAQGCGFRMFKTAFGKKLTEAQISTLLTQGKTKGVVKGLKSKKTGNTFEAQLVLDKATGSLKPVFLDNGKGKRKRK